MARAHLEQLQRGRLEHVPAAATHDPRTVRALAATHQVRAAQRAGAHLVRTERAVVIAQGDRLGTAGAGVDGPRHELNV